jgi:hypothetical protein
MSSIPLTHPRADYSQAKRFFCEKKGKEGEITNIKNKVFAGQILAEMLAGICHEEFYKYSDQEVTALPYMYTNSVGVRTFYNSYVVPVISCGISKDIFTESA